MFTNPLSRKILWLVLELHCFVKKSSKSTWIKADKRQVKPSTKFRSRPPCFTFFKKFLSKIWLWYKLVYKVGKERVFEGTGYSSRSALDPGNPVSKRFQATIRKMTKMHYCTVALYWYYMATKAISGNFTQKIPFSSRVAPSQLKKPRIKSRTLYYKGRPNFLSFFTDQWSRQNYDATK